MLVSVLLFPDREVSDGELFVEIFYNGKELYKNHFPLCTAEDSKYLSVDYRST